MNQGILPVITALLTLKTCHLEMHHIIPGMNFKKFGATNNAGDFDFVYVYKHELFGGECKAGSRLSQKDIETAKVSRQLGFRAFFFVTIKTFGEDGQALISNYQQELANDKNNGNPYDVFILDELMLFGKQPLPQQIPR